MLSDSTGVFEQEWGIFMKSGRRYVWEAFAAAMMICFLCSGCVSEQKETMAGTVIGEAVEDGGGSEEAAGESTREIEDGNGPGDVG